LCSLFKMEFFNIHGRTFLTYFLQVACPSSLNGLQNCVGIYYLLTYLRS
jgi:hypothetical protein